MLGGCLRHFCSLGPKYLPEGRYFLSCLSASRFDLSGELANLISFLGAGSFILLVQAAHLHAPGAIPVSSPSAEQRGHGLKGWPRAWPRNDVRPEHQQPISILHDGCNAIYPRFLRHGRFPFQRSQVYFCKCRPASIRLIPSVPAQTRVDTAMPDCSFPCLRCSKEMPRLLPPPPE